MKYLWSRVEKEAEKQSGSGGAESGQQGEPGKKRKPIASKKEEQKVVQEGKVSDDKRSWERSTAEGSTKISGIEKGKLAAMTGKEDGGPGAGVETVRQRLQGCRDGQKEWKPAVGVREETWRIWRRTGRLGHRCISRNCDLKESAGRRSESVGFMHT